KRGTALSSNQTRWFRRSTKRPRRNLSHRRFPWAVRRKIPLSSIFHRRKTQSNGCLPTRRGRRRHPFPAEAEASWNAQELSKESPVLAESALRRRFGFRCSGCHSSRRRSTFHRERLRNNLRQRNYRSDSRALCETGLHLVATGFEDIGMPGLL